MDRPGTRIAVGVVTVGAVLLPSLLWLGLRAAGPGPQTWTPLPGWSYQADGLSAGAATGGGLLAGVGLAATLPFLALGPRRLRTRTLLGWAVLLAGLAQTTFASQTLGRWLGLEVAGLALVLLDWPDSRAALGNSGSPFWRRVLGGVPLLAVALLGLLDTPHLPGQPLTALSGAVVGALLVSGVLRALYRPATGTPAAGYALGALYAPAACYPLLRSLAAGPWDPWARLLVAGAGLALLAWALITLLAQARLTTPPLIFRLPASACHILGAVLLGLGVGTPAAVAGTLALGAAGWIGGALGALAGPLPGRDGQALRLLGRLGVAGLPPFAGFAGLWLLAGALLPARYGLGLALLLILPALQLRDMVGIREQGSGSRNPVEQSGNTHHASRITHHASRFAPLLPPALLLLLGGLAPAGWIEGALIPALNALAAGVPALQTLAPVPGLGYQVGEPPALLAAWPALGLSVAVACAWLVIDIAVRVLRRGTRNEE